MKYRLAPMSGIIRAVTYLTHLIPVAMNATLVGARESVQEACGEDSVGCGLNVVASCGCIFPAPMIWSESSAGRKGRS